VSPRLRPHANIEEKRGSEGGSKGGIQRNKIGEWKRKRQTNERDRWIPCSCGYKREILSPKFISPSESTSGSEISRCKALEGGCGALAAGDPACAPQEGQNLRPGCRPSAPQAAHMRLLPAVSVSYAGGGISISAPIVGASIYGKKQKWFCGRFVPLERKRRTNDGGRCGFTRACLCSAAGVGVG
jgi:hypothetical protein